MISEELFDRQSLEYRNSVLPPGAIYDLMVVSTGTKRFWPLKNLGPLTEEYSLVSDKDDVWLTGGFLENWRTLDIDIVLTNKPIYSEIQKILIDGVKLGVEKYNMFVDLTHWNRKPLNYSDGDISLTKIGKLVTANKIVQNNKLITDWSDGKKVYSNLWYVEREYPKEKQLNRNYKNKPILLQKGLESGIKAYS